MQRETGSILGETIAAIAAILGPELDEIMVERVVVGLFFTGVKLSDGSAGSCATPIKTIPEAVCCPSSAMAMPFPGKLAGRRAIDLAQKRSPATAFAALSGSPRSMRWQTVAGSGGLTPRSN